MALLSAACIAGLTGCSPGNTPGVVTELTPTTLTLTASAILLNSGSTLVLTGTINPSAAPGYVAFFDGTTGLGVSALAAGTATLAISTLSTGTHAMGYGGPQRTTPATQERSP